jgi:hypothetical protein
MDVRYWAWAMAAEKRMQAKVETVRKAEEVERLIAASEAYREAQFDRTTFTKTLEKRFSSDQRFV